jgi:hypothetical protein
MVVLDVLEGGESSVSSVLLLHVELLSPVPVNDTLANLLGILFLRIGTQVLMVSVFSAFCFVLTASSTWSFSAISTSTVLDNVDPGVDGRRVLSVLLRLVSLVKLVNFVLDPSLLFSCF